MRLRALIIPAAAGLLLSACQSVPRFHDSCLAPAPETVMLLLERPEQNPHRLLLHTESSPAQRVWVALDTLGAPQFSARLQAGQMQVDASTLYRDIDPQTLLWGYQWWLLRDDADSAQRCAEQSGYDYQHSGGNSISAAEVYAGRRQLWQWQAEDPQVFELPRQQLSVRVQVLSP